MMPGKKGMKKNTLRIVPVDDSRAVSFILKWTDSTGKENEKSFASRADLFAHVRGLKTFMGLEPSSIVRTVSHSVTVES